MRILKSITDKLAKGYGWMLLAASLGAVSVSSFTVSADPVRPMSDQNFSKACVRMTGEYDQDITREQAQHNPYASHRLIVKSSNSQLDPESYGAVDAARDQEGLYVLQFSSLQDTRRAEEKLRKEESTIYVEPDYILFASPTEADQNIATSETDMYDTDSTGDESDIIRAASDSNWNVSMMGLDAYEQMILEEGYNKETVVAVLDTGIAYNHPLLKNRLITSAAASFVDGYTANEEDTFNSSNSYGTHGTMVAGIIAKCTASLNVKILPIRILQSEDGSGSALALGKGIEYAVSMGVDVINLSMGGLGNAEISSYLQEKITAAVSAGVVVVAAAGNNSREISSNYIVPANIPECVVTGAVDQNKDRYNKGNYGSTVDVAAPGVSVPSSVIQGSGSTFTYGYGSMTGTSASAPHVSAEAAMLKMVYSSQYAANQAASQIESIIQKETIDLGTAGKDNYYGYGLANLTSLSGLVYTVTYQPGTQGTFAQTSSKAAYGTSTPAAPTVTGNSGYEFAGWLPEVASTVTADVTYVAQWKQVSQSGTSNQTSSNTSTSTTSGTTAVAAGTVLYASTNPHANVTYKVPLKTKQKSNALKVLGLADGDYVVRWVSSKPSVAAVSGSGDGSCIVKAGKKGSALITAVTASGRMVVFRIKVQKNKVKTKKIQVVSKKIVLKAGETFDLKPTLYPITSSEKKKCKSSKNRVASVSSSGIVKARSAGKTVIQITSGSKKVKITVVVR